MQKRRSSLPLSLFVIRNILTACRAGLNVVGGFLAVASNEHVRRKGCCVQRDPRIFLPLTYCSSFIDDACRSSHPGLRSRYKIKLPRFCHPGSCRSLSRRLSIPTRLCVFTRVSSVSELCLSDSVAGSAREAAARISQELGRGVQGFVLCGADLLQSKGTYDKADIVVIARDSAPYTSEMQKAREALSRKTLLASGGSGFSGASSTLVRSFISKGEARLLRCLLLRGI